MMATGASVRAWGPACSLSSGRQLGGKFSVVVMPLPERSRRRRSTCRCAFTGHRGRTASPNTKAGGINHPVTNFYDLLGISDQVSLQEIKVAYREKARRFHPDANPPAKKEECTRKFLQVQEAYEVLTDPNLRADYDYRLRHPLSMQALKSGFSFMRGRGKSRGTQGGPFAEEELLNKQAWKSQWGTQLNGIKRDFGCRQKAGSWAATLKQKREEEEAKASSPQSELAF